MKRYTFYPGCTYDASAVGYKMSAEAILGPLGVELVELKDWNCCGSTPYSGTQELAAFCVAARNLALAEEAGLDLVTPCSSCYVILNRANLFFHDYPALKARVDEALAAGGLEYHGTVKVRHLLDVIVNDVGYDTIKSLVKRDLNDMKVAPYYGCQMVRPKLGFDDPEYPQTLDKLVAALGAKAVDFPLKSRCCGGSLMLSEEDKSLGLARNLLESASSHEADLMVTVCPLCQSNVDMFQSNVNKKFKTNYNMPILFFTQLIGFAIGLDVKDLGMDKSIVLPDRVLAGYLGRK